LNDVAEDDRQFCQTRKKCQTDLQLPALRGGDACRNIPWLHIACPAGIRKSFLCPQWCQTFRGTGIFWRKENNTYICFYQVLSITQGSAAGAKTMLKEKISAFIGNIRSIDGVAACALVSRDGIISGKYFDRELNEPWFGALSATILASAESVGSIIKSRSMLSVTIRAVETSTIIMGAGENFLIAAIISNNADPAKVHAEMLAVAQKIGEAM
jgi:predicted regulator of Ras-like GTPase activity (Roadblock/LC7/MglB family)